MKIKRSFLIVAMLCAAAAVGAAVIPKAVLDSIPTATVVKVESLEHEDCVTVSGTVTRNLRDDSVCVQVYVPEQDISKVKIGQSAEITGDAFPDKVYQGTVDKISDVAMKIQSGKTAVEVSVGIDSPDEILKHGYTASVKLHTSEPSLMNVIPYEAVEQDDNGEYVYYLKNGRAYKRYVETGRELSGGIELKTAFSDDEKIITVDRSAENGSAVKLGDQGEAA